MLHLLKYLRIPQIFILLMLAGCSHIKPNINQRVHNKQASHQKISKPNDAISNIISTTPKAHRAAKKDQIHEITYQNIDNKNFLKPVYNKDVKFWVKYFSGSNKERFERYLKNGMPYKKMIENIFTHYGLPKELFYVGLIESGYYLRARSRASAVGPWQFIRSTGKRYGLKVSRGVDERRSIVKSTTAAALFFQDLYNIFGSWELALSAYNAGENGIIRRIRGANTRDFYELSRRKVIPAETRQYVPKVLAAMEVAMNPKKYKLNMPDHKINIYDQAKMITIRRSTSLNSLAAKAGISKSTLMTYNPDLLWKNVSSWRSGLDIYLPDASDEKTLASLMKRSNKTYRRSSAKITSTTKNYKINKGDNLHKIARKFGISISKLLRSNKLNYKSKLYAGKTLKIPLGDRKLHTVRSGDYLIKLAKNYGTTVNKIRRLNSLEKKSKIYPGQKLIISMN